MATVRFAGLEKRYGEHAVLAALDLEIADGEFFTFVGPSGCGKSTLLNLIAGVDAPSAGSIDFDGVRVDPLPPGERDVATVFQSYALYPHLTVRRNIGFPLTVRRVPAAEIHREVERVAAMLGLAALLERKPRQLSGGQRQRVALGRALIRRPRVFLMDEPLSNLDAQLRLEMREELKRLHVALGITTIYVTHDQEEAMALSDRVAVLRDGRVQQCAAPQVVYDAPANLFVAQFLGSPPINLLDGATLASLADLGIEASGRDPRDLQVGVRPVDVRVHAAARPGTLAATVTLVEPTGGDLWVVTDWNGQRIKGRAEPGFEPGRDIRAHLALDPRRLHLFDRATGTRIAAA